ncbi:MAG: GNAT family N-acetyltransferase [Chloroflexi bacterium]|nr:GNAT family N-acetyltransferase [Chloroflexota bacterium]
MIDLPGTVLRAAAPADATRIAELFTDEGYPVTPSAVEARLGRLRDPDSQVVVADAEGVVIGFVALHVMPRFEHDDVAVRVLALVVDAGARERGVGRALLARVEELAAAAGAAFVEVTAGHHRPDARHLYESLGYDAALTAYLRKRL